MKVYKDYPKEGETYEIENFRLVHNNDPEKLVAHPFKLFFHPFTTFRKLDMSKVVRGLPEAKKVTFNFNPFIC